MYAQAVLLTYYLEPHSPVIILTLHISDVSRPVERSAWVGTSATAQSIDILLVFTVYERYVYSVVYNVV